VEESKQAETNIPAGTEQAPADPCAELRQQLVEAQAKADNYLDQWRRSAAEFSNFKKRTERESSEFQRFALADFIKKLLPVLDDLNRAFANLPEAYRGDGWVNGVDLVRQKLDQILAGEGLTPLGEANETFDPSRHEAVTYEDNKDYEDGKVISVVQKGYRMGDRILRPAQVRVSRRS